MTLTAAAAKSKPPPAPATARQASAKPTALTGSIERLLARPELKGARVGVHVVRLSDGKTLYEHEAERLFVPASNAKLFTTAAAQHALGADYQFRTLVGVSGRDLVVVGGGDPTIGGRLADGDPTAYFRRWAGVLKEHGITRIEGDLVLDDSFFDRQLIHPHWPKSDLGHWYAAPIAALTLNDGCVDVRITPGARPGAAARVSLIPPTRYLRVENHTHTVSSSKEHAPRVSRRPGSDVVQCEGGVYERADPVMGWVTVDDPTMYFGTVLREVLSKEGIPIVGKVRREPGIGRSTQFRARVAHRFPLLAVLTVANKQSRNFYAEQILKTLGAERGDGSWQGGCQAARDALGELGLDPASYVLDDGCGLSRDNRASPKAFTTLLAAMHQHSHGEQYRQTLAVSGVDGTLRKRLTDEPYRGRVHAKTGSFTGVRAMSGYVQTRSGEWLAFSLLINDVRTSVRSIQDEFCKVLVDCTRD